MDDIRLKLRDVYQRFDEMCHAGSFDRIDEEIGRALIEEPDSHILVCYLTATLACKSKLPSRPRLFEETKRLMKIRGHYTTGVLKGLE